jgi:hypothetical protein
VSDSKDLRTLSGETERIFSGALAQGTLSKEEILAAVLLLKTQRNDARKEVERLRAALREILPFVDGCAEGDDGFPVIGIIRAALAVTP